VYCNVLLSACQSIYCLFAYCNKLTVSLLTGISTGLASHEAFVSAEAAAAVSPLARWGAEPQRVLNSQDHHSLHSHHEEGLRKADTGGFNLDRLIAAITMPFFSPPGSDRTCSHHCIQAKAAAGRVGGADAGVTLQQAMHASIDTSISQTTETWLKPAQIEAEGRPTCLSELDLSNNELSGQYGD
jgi:hypothetical protein